MARYNLEDKLKTLKTISSLIKEFEHDDDGDIVFYAESILESIQEIEDSLLEEEFSPFKQEQSYDHSAVKEARYA